MVVVLLIIAIGVIININDISRKYFYPIKYSEYVEMYADENNIDKYLIYAVIKTESNYDEKAVSSVGARGLMQIMEDAFDWVSFKMNDTRDLKYDNMFDAEYNIQYGSYLIMLLYDEYQDEETALAAYHSGRTNVNNWLKDDKYSSDGKTLDAIPSAATNYYVKKVMKAYNAYTNLYEN